jgi:hypothetical protein
MFKIGQVVRVKEGSELGSGDYFEGNAIFRGQSERYKNYVVLERLDGINGAGENGWWVFDKNYLDCLEVVEDIVAEFQIGQLVRVKRGSGRLFYNSFEGNAIFIGEGIDKWKGYFCLQRLDGETDSASCYWHFDKKYLDCLEVVGDNKLTPLGETNKPKGKTMQKLTATVKRIFSKDLQLQYKAGLIDGCGRLTSDGQEEVNSFLLELAQEKLTKRAKEIIKEDK